MFSDRFFSNNQKETKKVLALPIAYGETNIGLRRRNNEDSLLIFNAADFPNKNLHNVYAVTDGVGGCKYGEIAAKFITSSISKFATRGLYITRESLKQIDSSIDMGASTLVLAQQSRENPNDYHIFSVGDSSALIIDTRRGTLEEITRRDENAQGLVTQVMGPEAPSVRFNRAHESRVLLKPNQTLVLATDGFTRYIDKKQITVSRILNLRNHSQNESDFVKSLIDECNHLGGVDNITIISIPHQPQL